MDATLTFLEKLEKASNFRNRDRAKWLNEYNRRITAKYDAAGTNPELERYWSQSDRLSATAANSKQVRERLRSRSRYECQESNCYAKGMLLAKTNDVIGRGPQLQITTPERALNVEVQRRWNQWSRSIALDCKIRTGYGAKVGDGETFGQRTFNAGGRDDVKLDVRFTEADLWTDPEFNIGEPNQDDGIQYDESGNPVTYRRLDSHPGDNFGFDRSFKDIPADDVIHWYRCDRPGQRRGVPEFTAALPLFAELRRYRMAVLTAAETAANLSAVMFSDANAFSDAPDELDDDFLTISLERRALLTLPAGWKMEQLRPNQPQENHVAFVESIASEIGRTLQMPLNIVIGSSRQYNYSSGRLDYLLYWNSCDTERSECELLVLDRIFGWWLDEALLIPGYLPRLGSFEVLPHRWKFPARRPLDEVKAAQADQIRFELGQLTDEDWATREAIDIEEHYERQIGRAHV